MMPKQLEPSQSAESRATSLADLRARIDALDETVHRSLMERASIIQSLVQVKRNDRSGSAFRPAREADMMRRLSARHSGMLPIATVEHLWREIISTFTYLQANFSVHLWGGDNPGLARDMARFQFGFTVPLIEQTSADAVVSAVENSVTDLGILPLAPQATNAWWQGLDEQDGPRVISRLPFIVDGDRADVLAALVISRPLADPVAPEIGVFEYSAGDYSNLPDGIDLLVQAGDTALIAAPGELDGDEVAQRLGVSNDVVRPIGGYAAPIIL